MVVDRERFFARLKCVKQPVRLDQIGVVQVAGASLVIKIKRILGEDAELVSLGGGHDEETSLFVSRHPFAARACDPGTSDPATP
ncbi:hypothetical protein ACIBF6_38285 [Streptosporangium amethystogenes]|uniref:hypothetical protein n=1 Tax=Streptosporangium amethystogenes TaxID=2002 RepID=UPI0037990349